MTVKSNVSSNMTFHDFHLMPAIRKNDNFFGSYNMLEIIKLNHSFKVCVPVDHWKMKISKLS